MNLAPYPKNSRDEFKRWLHLFCIHDGSVLISSTAFTSVETSTKYPWVWQSLVPDFEWLAARWNMCGFKDQPEDWKSFWFDLRAMRYNAAVRANGAVKGPYWMITNSASIASVAQIMATKKRTIANIYFKAPPVYSERADNVTLGTAFNLSELLYESLRIYDIYEHGELIDETERTGEICWRSIQEWDRAPLNRPPGRRQVGCDQARTPGGTE